MSAGLALLALIAVLAAPFIVSVLGGVYGWDCDANRAGDDDPNNK